MNAATSPRAVRMSMALCRLFLGCYPRRTRERFVKELTEVYASVLAAAYAAGGNRAVIACWPSMLADLSAAIFTEYTDRWREGRVSPTAFAGGCLAVAAVVWTLILVATLADARWAAAVLDFNLALTMLLAFGLPVAAAIAMRADAPVGVPRRSRALVTRLSTWGTVTTWSVLAFHLA